MPHQGTQAAEEQLGGRRKDLVLFPDDVQARLQPRLQRAEAEGALRRGVGQAVQGDGIAHPRLHQDGRVEHQVVIDRDVQLAKVGPEPVHKGVFAGVGGDDLPGAQQGQAQQVGLFDAVLAGQRAVPAHQHPPHVPGGQGQGVVFGDVRRLDDDAEIQQPLVQPLGHVLGDGIDICGERLDRDIGIKAEEYAVTSPEDGDIAAFFPERKRNSHKGTYGSCQIVAGDCYVGAAALSVSSALLSGCGYVSATVGERLKYALVAAYPQVIYSDGINFSASATAIGMGCGCNKTTYEKVCNLIEGYGGKLIIDADGINSLAAYGKEVLKGAKCKIVITPHVREFSRISGCTEEDILSDPAGRAKAFAAEYGVVVHLKNCVTLTTDGHKVSLVTRGSSALARAGSGDILSGLVAGYAARGLDVFDAAVCAQSVLGRAAEIAGKECGEYCTTSQDIIKNIKNVVKSLT